MDTPSVGPMSRLLADKTKRFYVCSGCWSELIIVPDKTNPQLDLVKCLNCECPGYVSKSYVERAKSESYARASRENAQKIADLIGPGKRREYEAWWVAAPEDDHEFYLETVRKLAELVAIAAVDQSMSSVDSCINSTPVS